MKFILIPNYFYLYVFALVIIIANRLYSAKCLVLSVKEVIVNTLVYHQCQYDKGMVR